MTTSIYFNLVNFYTQRLVDNVDVLDSLEQLWTYIDVGTLEDYLKAGTLDAVADHIFDDEFYPLCKKIETKLHRKLEAAKLHAQMQPLFDVWKRSKYYNEIVMNTSLVTDNVFTNDALSELIRLLDVGTCADFAQARVLDAIDDHYFDDELYPLCKEFELKFAAKRSECASKAVQNCEEVLETPKRVERVQKSAQLRRARRAPLLREIKRDRHTPTLEDRMKMFQ